MTTRRSFLIGAAVTGVAASGLASWAGLRAITEITPNVRLPGQAAGHRLRDMKALPAPAETRRVGVAICGSGIGGLSCAWRLAKGGSATWSWSRARALRQRGRRRVRHAALSDRRALPAAAVDGIDARARDAGRLRRDRARPVRPAPDLRRAGARPRAGRAPVARRPLAGRLRAARRHLRSRACRTHPLLRPRRPPAPDRRARRPPPFHSAHRACLRRPGLARARCAELPRLAAPRRLPRRHPALVRRLLLPRRLRRHRRPCLGLGGPGLLRQPRRPRRQRRAGHHADLAEGLDWMATACPTPPA